MVLVSTSLYQIIPTRMKTVFLLAISAASLCAQTAGFPETIFSQPVTDITTNRFSLGTVTPANAPGVQETIGVVGSPIGVSPNTVMLSWPPPPEVFSIYRVNPNFVFALRGMYSTYTYTHPQGQMVWIGPGNYFRNSNPSGKCDPTAQLVLPVVTIPSGIVWNCPTTGIEWLQATFSWVATTPIYSPTTTWQQSAGTGLSTWTQGITWDEDVGWFDTTAIAWNSL